MRLFDDPIDAPGSRPPSGSLITNWREFLAAVRDRTLPDGAQLPPAILPEWYRTRDDPPALPTFWHYTRDDG